MRRVVFLLATLLLAIGCKDNPVDDNVTAPTLELDSETLELDYREQRVEVGVKSEGEVDVTEEVLWINVIGVDGGKIKLSIKENSSESAREADVLITSGEHSCTLHITQRPKPDVMQLKLGHRATLLDSPIWGGDNISGRVDWGDGTTEEYQEGVSHQYPDNQERTATFEIERATSFEIERLGEIESVEITL